jgi:flagellar biosynthesis protein FlhF
MQQFFIEQARTYEEAESKARKKYGERLTILQRETVRIRGGFLNIFSQEGVKITGIIPFFNRGAVPQKEAYSAGKLPMQTTAQVNMPVQKAAPDFAGEKEKILALAGKDNALKEVLAEVRNIKDKLESQGLAASQEEHPTFNRIDDLLTLNDFPVSFRKTLLDRMRKEITVDGLNNFNAVQDMVLEWIGDSVKIYENDKFRVRPRIMILVGPTGVGKTTTVAKLAASFGLDEKGSHKRRVVLVTIDSYRIGAKQQLEVYSNVMEFPCFSVTDYDELKRIIAMNSEGTDLILIDTIGKSPRDIVKLGEMKMLLDACGTVAEVHLVVAATTKSSDLAEIFRHFESFNYRSVIVTKIDETIRTGNVIGVLSEKAKPVSYITDGQKVPTDIKKASVIQFLINLEGFKVNRIKLEERFPQKGQEQMQKWR